LADPHLILIQFLGVVTGFVAFGLYCAWGYARKAWYAWKARRDRGC
jgi:hypothetical protein